VIEQRDLKWRSETSGKQIIREAGYLGDDFVRSTGCEVNLAFAVDCRVEICDAGILLCGSSQLYVDFFGFSECGFDEASSSLTIPDIAGRSASPSKQVKEENGDISRQG
jgi:hypothetical protein